MEQLLPYVLYAFTHVVPLFMVLLFIYLLGNPSIHYTRMCYLMNTIHAIYLIATVVGVIGLTWCNVPYCCDHTLNFGQGLLRDSRLYDTLFALYEFMCEAGPSHIWPTGHKGLFRSVCIAGGYLTFAWMFITVALIRHGWIMFLTILTYAIVMVVALHVPIAFSLGFMWLFCFYIQSQALRRKYYMSNNRVPPDIDDYFGDHFY